MASVSEACGGRAAGGRICHDSRPRSAQINSPGAVATSGDGSRYTGTTCGLRAGPMRIHAAGGSGSAPAVPQASGQASRPVQINGRRHPILVPLTSNHLAADLLDHSDVGIGDEAVLIGKQGDREVSAEEVAKQAGISVYQLLIGMNPLLPKRYINVQT